MRTSKAEQRKRTEYKHLQACFVGLLEDAMCKPVHTCNKLLRPVFKLAGVTSCEGRYSPFWEHVLIHRSGPGDDIMRDSNNNCCLNTKVCCSSDDVVKLKSCFVPLCVPIRAYHHFVPPSWHDGGIYF